MKKQEPSNTQKNPLQMLTYLIGIGIILFILFSIGFSIWGIIYTA